ncbi:hypothetical protein KI387_034876, partial [Taxus chinensis]
AGCIFMQLTSCILIPVLAQPKHFFLRYRPTVHNLLLVGSTKHATGIATVFRSGLLSTVVLPAGGTPYAVGRLFQFIEGANLNFSRIPMTAPVLTSIVPGAGPFDSSGYIVRFYLPTKFQDSPPVPLPELKLYPDHWDSHCVAIRKFSGFAKDNNIVKEAANLAASLSKSPWADLSFDDGENNAYSIAQYNSPFKIFGRLNEVW